MKVKEVMSTDVACCRTESPLQEVALMMVQCDCGEIPVTDAVGRVIGVITDRDVTCRAVAQGRNPLGLTAGDCMTSPAVTIRQDASLAGCCEVLEEHQIRRVPVVDDAGRCIGIVSQADIARHGSKRDAGAVVRRVSQPTVRASAAAL